MNINFSTKDSYQRFADYIHSINIEAVVKQNVHTPYQRKIVIPIGGGGCNFILHPGELEDLKRLCISNLNKSVVAFGELNLDYSLN
jgi:hypothetical protein